MRRRFTGNSERDVYETSPPTFSASGRGRCRAAGRSRIARAQAYPTRPVRMIVGFAAGGATDIVARLMGQWLSERLGQQFIIENRPGAGSNIATEAVVRAPADGYTLLLVGRPNAINATLYDKLNFNFIRDIAPVAGIVRAPHVMVVIHPFRPRRFPSSSPTPKPIRARSTWRRPELEASPHLAGRAVQDDGRHQHLVHVPYRGVAARTDRSARRPSAGRCSHFVACVDRIHQGRQAARSRGKRQRRARKRCRTFRPWASLCRATRPARGSAWARPGTRRRDHRQAQQGDQCRLLPIPR